MKMYLPCVSLVSYVNKDFRGNSQPNVKNILSLKIGVEALKEVQLSQNSLWRENVDYSAGYLWIKLGCIPQERFFL